MNYEGDDKKMDKSQKMAILHAASRFPASSDVKISYGTAGFRAEASFMSSTVFRVGILAALRSLKTRSITGLMITASHNHVFDNGVKIIDPDGGMMTKEWEPFADAIVDAHDGEHLLKVVTHFVDDKDIILQGDQHASVLLGRDTRPSGEVLLEAAKQGIAVIIGSVSIDTGIVTTPQLHWMVRCRNKGLKASELDYFMELSDSFERLTHLMVNVEEGYKPDLTVTVDGANGVGGRKLEELMKLLKSIVIYIRNSGKDGEGILNGGVGAEYVHKDRLVPSGFGPLDIGKRCASLDGDADRFVYFYLSKSDARRINLIDGDKILSLFALFIKEQLDLLGETGERISLGVIQTAYANGASTNYLRQIGLDVIFAPTGVKYLHEKAAKYDVGIYFEANGHGTILLSEKFLGWLSTRIDELRISSAGSEKEMAASRLMEISKLVNHAVGDAFSGLLLVEAILLYYGWSVETWNQLYRDLPSRQIKVKVADKTAITTTNAETEIVNPAGLQKALESEASKYLQGRCFVRPSGTENVVRVYAEAATEEDADTLANSVAQHVCHFLGAGRR